MAKFNNLMGQVFGRLTVLRPAGSRNGHATWICRCLCGNEVEVASRSLVSGNTQSCGCLRKEMVGARGRARLTGLHGKDHPGFKHGHAGQNGRTPTLISWGSVIQRTTNPNAHEHENYIDRGIVMCERWRNSFQAFLDDMGERPAGTSLGRFGDVGHYSCGHCNQCKQNGWELNCAWQNRGEQAAEQKIKRARIARQAEDQVLDEIFATAHAA